MEKLTASQDVVSEFKAGDAFYDQFLVIQAVIADIQAVRQRYQEDVYAVISKDSEANHSINRSILENGAISIRQNSSAAIGIVADTNADAGQQAPKFGNHETRNISKGPQKDCRRFPPNQDAGPRDAKPHKDSNKFQPLGSNPGFASHSHGTILHMSAAQHSSIRAARSPTLPAIAFARPGLSRPGLPNDTHGAISHMSAVRNASTSVAQGPTLPAIPPPRHRSLKGTHGAGLHTFTTKQTSATNIRGPKLTATPSPHPGIPFDIHDAGWKMSAAQHSSIMAARNPRLPPSPLNHPWNIGPPVYMDNYHRDRILRANGVKPPAPNFFAVPNYYSGPLHCSTAAEAIKMVADFGKSKHDDTMLEPYVVPLIFYHPSANQMEIHAAECERHKKLMQEVLAVPSESNRPVRTLKWYRILGDLRLKREPVVWHPNVIDLFGHESQYEYLLIRDINKRNNNDKGVGRKNSPFKLKIKKDATEEVEKRFQKQSQKGTTVGMGAEIQKNPTTMHARQDSDEMSNFFRDKSGPSLLHSNVQYLGYSIRNEKHQQSDNEAKQTSPKSPTPSSSTIYSMLDESYRQQSPEGSPRPPTSQGCSFQSSAGNTLLSDFEKSYSATHGDQEEVDFAIRDKGPPRFNGKTFNEAIGYTPTPEERPHLFTSTCYPTLFAEPKPRD